MLFKGNSTKLALLIERIHKKDTLESDIHPFRRDGSFSSVVSSEGACSSPGGSSCATPTSSGADVPENQLVFTLGVTDSTPYQCLYCDKAFQRQNYLKKHQQTHKEYLPFECEFCRQRFKHKRSRDRHVKLHTGEKKYKCEKCGHRYSRSDHLNIHKKTHDLRKPHQCSLCNRGYNTVAALTSHLQKHNKSPPEPSASPPLGQSFKCLECETKFGTPEDLQNHMKEEHNVYPSSELHNSSSQNMSPLARSISKLHSSVYRSSPSPLSFPLQFPLTSSPSRFSSSPGSMPGNARYMCNYCPTGSEGFSSLESLHVHIQTAHGSLLNGSDLIRELSARLSHSLSSPLSLSPALSPFPSSTPTTTSSSIPPPWSLYSRGGRASASVSELLAYRSHQQQQESESARNKSKYGASQRDLDQVKMEENGNKTQGFSQSEPTDLTVNKKHKLKSQNQSSNNSSNSNDHKRPKLNGAASHLEEQSSVMKHYENAHKLHICSRCDASFPDLASFSLHQKTHLEAEADLQTRLSADKLTEQPPPSLVQFECAQCSARFADVRGLSDHVTASHTLVLARRFSCPGCQAEFESEDSLAKHCSETHTVKLYRCSLCSELFHTQILIQLHFTQAHVKELKLYRCTKCPSVPTPHSDTSPTVTNCFPSHAEFTAHVRQAHPLQPSDIVTRIVPQAPPLLQCIFCFRQFHSASELQLHLHEHTAGPLQCPLCPKSFRVQFLLETHLTTHHASLLSTDSSVAGVDTKPPILSPSTLKSLHITSPSNQNASLFCDLCERKDFLSEPELAAHRKLHLSKSTGKVSLSCAYCPESFKSRSDLETHTRLHSTGGSTSITISGGSTGVSGGKHKCNICDEIFPSATALAEHKLSHCKVVYGTTCTKCKGSITSEEQYLQHLQQHSASTSNNSSNSTPGNILLPTSCIICCQTLNSEVETKLHSNFHLQPNPVANSLAGTVASSLQNNIFTTAQSVVNTLSSLQNSLLATSQSNTIAPMNSNSLLATSQSCVVNFPMERGERGFASSTNGGRDDNGGGKRERELCKMGERERKAFACSQCPLSFDTEVEWQNHSQRVHFVSPVHECRLCCQTLPDATALQAHLIEHTFEGLSSYTCFICLTQFTAVSGLQGHIRDHHGPQARSYECTRCPARFFFKAELENHTRGGHPDMDDARIDYEKMSNYFHYQKSLQQYQQLKDQHQHSQYKQHRASSKLVDHLAKNNRSGSQQHRDKYHGHRNGSTESLDNNPTDLKRRRYSSDERHDDRYSKQIEDTKHDAITDNNPRIDIKEESEYIRHTNETERNGSEKIDDEDDKEEEEMDKVSEEGIVQEENKSDILDGLSASAVNRRDSNDSVEDDDNEMFDESDTKNNTENADNEDKEDVEMNGIEENDVEVNNIKAEDNKTHGKDETWDGEEVVGTLEKDMNVRIETNKDRELVCKNNNNNTSDSNKNGQVKVEIKFELDEEEDIDVGNNHC